MDSDNSLDTTHSVRMSRESSQELSSENLSNFSAPNSPQTPNIREANYGETLRDRTQLQEKISGESTPGPSDLFHVAKYVGGKSSQYVSDFSKSKPEDKHDDGYIGMYHHLNGMKFEYLEQDIEEYVTKHIGLEKKNKEHVFRPSEPTKREIVVTYCTYNIFSKCDFKAKFVIHSLKSVSIDKSYQIVSNVKLDSRHRKVYSFNEQTIKGQEAIFWEELRASLIIRLFYQLDNPSNQLTGLVNYSTLIESKKALLGCIKLLVKFLPKGFLTGTNPGHGTLTACGNKNRKTNQYRNYLVDTILRICLLDITGATCQFAINEIKALNGEWDYVVLKLFKLRGCNREQEFLELVHKNLSKDLYTTQLGLILQEQVKFLISRGSFKQALDVAKKSVSILPLDFGSWYDLTLCYVLVKDYENALLVLNSIPLILNSKQKLDSESVCGIKDFYVSTFIHRLNSGEEGISEKTFGDFFPNTKPKIKPSKSKKSASSLNSKLSTTSNFNSSSTTSFKPPSSTYLPAGDGSVKKLWNDYFIFNPHLRHNFSGHKFYHSPLINCSARELSSVDPAIIRICGPNSIKNILSSQSSSTPCTSIIDFERKSTWGRCYDILSLLVAQVGWDELITLKENVFKTSLPNLEHIVNHEKHKKMTVSCEKWLEQLFLILYEDLRSLMTISVHDKHQQHSAIEWEMLGLMGWSVKYNLKESISSLITSVMGNQEGFDYFGTVQLLEIYNEFVLSEIESNIDIFYDDYDLKFFSNKLILKCSNFYDGFVKKLETDYLTLDFILLNLMKLISWNLLWYQYAPNYLVTKTLSKLVLKYDSVYICTHFRVVFEKNKKSLGSKKGFLGSLIGSAEKELVNYEFVDGDTIFEYVEKLVSWIDG